MVHRSKYKMKNCKNPRSNIGDNLDETDYGDDFIYNTKGMIHERNN